MSDTNVVVQTKHGAATSRVTLSVEEAQQRAAPALPGALVGAEIQKRFESDGKVYTGRVVDYLSKHKWYKVMYEDGDEEEFIASEILPLLKRR